MKTLKTFKQLFAAIVMISLFAVSGWGACSGTSVDTWNTTTTSYSDSNNNFSNSYYTITVAQAGTLNLTVNNTSSGFGTKNITATLYPNSACNPTALWSSGTISEGNNASTGALSVTAGTYTLQLSRSSSYTSGYSWSGTFAPSIPPVITDATRSVAENSPAGTNVGTPITAANSPTSFSITGGDGQSLFDIDNSGQITVKSGAVLDYETTPSYTLLVTATNSAGTSNEATITINVTILKNLSIAMSAPASTASNTVIQYDINVTNNETTDEVNNVTVTDTFTNATYQGSYGDGWSCDYDNSTTTVTCTYASLLAAKTTTPVHILVQAGSSTVTNTATAVNSNHIPDFVTKTTTISGSIANNRDFAIAYSTNDTGNIKIIGNSMMTNKAGCNDDANNALSTNGSKQAVFANIDGATTNSSSAQLSLPLGATSSDILYAGLYWQGRTSGPKSTSVDLRFEGDSSYQTIPTIGSKYNVNGPDYQGVADVTSYLQANVDKFNASNPSNQYNQDIFVANINADLDSNKYAAWAIIVVYRDTTEPYKNLVVYDGFKNIAGSNATSATPPQYEQTISGFLTPSLGVVNSSFFIFGGEGDLGYGDTVSLSNKSATDVSLHYPSTTAFTTPSGVQETFTSSETDSNGTNITSRDPNCYNTLGIDIHSYDVGTNSTLNIIGNNQTSTTVKFSSFKVYPTKGSDGYSAMYDTYFPGMFAFATDLYQPRMCYDEQIFDSSGNDISGVGTQVNQDDVLTVRVTIKNDGDDTAKGVQVLHQFDNDKFPYNTGTTSYINYYSTSSTLINASDSSGNDNFEYDNTTYLAKINLGSGASGSGGGQFIPFTTTNNAYSIYEYNATVKVLDQNFTNEYKAAYKSDYGLDYSAHPVTMEPCSGQRNSFYGYQAPSQPGSVDVVDTDEYSNYATQPVIKTKIASKSNIQLTAVYLGPNNLQQNYNSSTFANAPLEAFLYRTDSTCTEELALAEPTTGNPAGQPVIAHILNGANSGNTNTFTMKAVANKDTRIKIKYADWSAILSGFTSANSCFNNSNWEGNLNGLPQCLNDLGSDSGLSQDFLNRYPNISSTCLNQASGHSACDSNEYDNQGSKGNITPQKYNHTYGCLACILDAIPDVETCSTDNFAIRPEKLVINSTNPDMFNLLRSAQDYNTSINAYNYNTTVDTLDYNVTSANTIFSITTTLYDKNNLELNATTTPPMNGTASFGGSDFNMSNGISIKAGIVGNEVAGLTFDDVGKVNIRVEDHQWAAVDNDDTPMNCDANGTYVCGDRNVTFIPDHFDFNTLTITNNNGNPGTFTYLANEVNQTAARIDTQIRALNHNGNVTQNFSPYPLYENNITVTPVVVKPTYLYPDANETRINNILVGFASGVKNIAWNDTNSSTYLRFNFKRDVNQPVNPFDVNESDLNISVSSLYTDGASTATIIGNRDMNATGKSTFIYGRTHAPRYRFLGNNGDAPIYFEVYCNGAGCDTTLLPTLVPGIYIESVDSIGWYQNNLHNPVTDGNITALTAPLVTSGHTIYFNATDVWTLVYDAGNPNRVYPYITTERTSASGWLIYNKYDANATANEFEVEFNSAGDWAGKHETNTSTDSNASSTTSKRIFW